jgi:hypothetical protein
MAGSSPAKRIFGCIWIVGDNRFPSTGQPWVLPRHPRAAAHGVPVSVDARYEAGQDDYAEGESSECI